MALPDEYRMLRKTGFTRANVAYFVSRWVFVREHRIGLDSIDILVSRIGTLGYCVCASVFEGMPSSTAIKCTADLSV